MRSVLILNFAILCLVVAVANSFCPLHSHSGSIVLLQRSRSLSSRRAVKRPVTKGDDNNTGLTTAFRTLTRSKNAKSSSNMSNKQTQNTNTIIIHGRKQQSNGNTKADTTFQHDEESDKALVMAIGVGVLAIVAIVAQALDFDPAESYKAIQLALEDPKQAVQDMVTTVQDMGPLGALYYSAFYVVFEVLAVPVIFLLTSSAGFLFGVGTGTCVALLSACIAATISFYLGRTLLRGPVERWLEDLPQFRNLDRAIESQGFKITLLERLSPWFPFALSSYVYGATSIDFASFFWGTLCGFAPGTFVYVYTGVAGKALALGEDGGGNTPWYYYVGGVLALGALFKVLADVVTDMIAEMERENGGEEEAGV